MTLYADPVDLLHEFGIARPADIDLAGIAAFLGAEVLYRPLDGCEARIVGRQGRARITVDSRQAPRRQRFSIAHEIGHWVHHRGIAMYCRSAEIGGGDGVVDGERLANWYAANLLMPTYLFGPACRSIVAPYTWKKLQTVADDFEVSALAAAVRLMDEADHPLVLACYDVHARRWFKRTKSAGSLFPPDEPDARCGVLASILEGRRAGQRTLPSAVWFPSYRAANQIIEDIHVWEGRAYVLLQPAGPMREQPAASSGRR